MASRISRRSSRHGSWVSGVGAAATAFRSPEQDSAEDGMPSGHPWRRRSGPGVVGMSRRPFVCSAGLAGSTPGVLPAPHLPRPEPAAARRVPSSYAIGGALSTGRKASLTRNPAPDEVRCKDGRGCRRGCYEEHRDQRSPVQKAEGDQENSAGYPDKCAPGMGALPYPLVGKGPAGANPDDQVGWKERHTQPCGDHDNPNGDGGSLIRSYSPTADGPQRDEGRYHQPTRDIKPPHGFRPVGTPLPSGNDGPASESCDRAKEDGRKPYNRLPAMRSAGETRTNGRNHLGS